MSEIKKIVRLEYYIGSEQPITGIIDGLPDLTQEGHVLEFNLAESIHDNSFLSLSSGNGITGNANGSYAINVGEGVAELKPYTPYYFTLWYEAPGVPRDAVANGVFELIGTVWGTIE